MTAPHVSPSRIGALFSTTFVAGVGMNTSDKPGKTEPCDVMGAKAIALAPQDAGLGYDKIQQVYAGYVYGDNTYGGRVVTNPSGGLLSKGHPLGAKGLAQCTELVAQLRGRAGVRQVEGARIALQHNLGLGGACVVTMYGVG